MKAITDSMVVMMPNSHRRNPGSNPRGSQIYSLLLPQNWQVGTIGGGGGVQVTLADSCRIRGMLSHGGGGGEKYVVDCCGKIQEHEGSM